MKIYSKNKLTLLQLSDKEYIIIFSILLMKKGSGKPLH